MGGLYPEDLLLSRDEVEDFLHIAGVVLTGPTSQQAASEIERLRANYAEFEDMDEDVLRLVIFDCIRDCMDMPHAYLVEACRRWRNSEATRAPTAGQLKAIVKEDWRALQRARALADRALELLPA